MTWLLVLTLSAPGEPSQMRALGVMIDEPTCIYAGQVLALALEQSVPGLTAIWTCIPQTEGAA